MKDLLPFVERELSILGAYFQRFAEQYPGIAGDLKLNNDNGGDPDIRRLTQAAAVLNARTAKKLDDDFPEITASFLDMLAPHLLRPVPSSSIACFGAAGAKGNSISAPVVIPRGTMLKAPERSRDGLICKFRSVFPVTLAALSISSAKFSLSINAPPGARLAPGAASEIAVAIAWSRDTSSPTGFPIDTLRLFVNGEPSFCAALLDALFLHTVSAYLETSDGRWHRLDKIPLAAVGMSADEALLPGNAKSQQAFRLLTEYFCFPAKFNFFDIDLAALVRYLPVGSQQATLHFALPYLDHDLNAARLLKSLSAQHLVTACTPIVNLFRQAACPIKLSYLAEHYTLIADPMRASAYEVFSVDSVRMVRDGAANSELIEFRPYYSLSHGEDSSRKGHYWIMRRDAALAATNPGYENQLSFVDEDFNPLTATSSSISIDLTCSNGSLPGQLEYGAPGGDLSVEASIGNHHIRLLRRPSAPCPSPSGRNMQWKLASHLALTMSSLSQDGLPAFREMLVMHDRLRSAMSRRQIDGIVGLETTPARVWLRDKYGGDSVRGIAIRMTIDEAAFVGNGIHAFAQVMDHFLAMYVHLNSFTQLTVVSQETGKELLTCPPRNGELNLA